MTTVAVIDTIRVKWPFLSVSEAFFVIQQNFSVFFFENGVSCESK